MSTPHDEQRNAAFRAWIEHIGGIAAAAEATGIATRSLERMRAGTQPPPVALLEKLAKECWTAGARKLAEMLARAAEASLQADNA